jgi:hypothetical protein
MTAGQGTAEIHGTNCDYDARGFEATAPPGTFGDSFNQDSGGVWATQIEAEDIEVWHFKRSAIPADVASDTLDPSTWGKPVLSMLPQNCDISKVWKKMKIVGVSACSYGHLLTKYRSSTSPSAESLQVAEPGTAKPSAVQGQVSPHATTLLPRHPQPSTRFTS